MERGGGRKEMDGEGVRGEREGEIGEGGRGEEGRGEEGRGEEGREGGE